MNLVPIRNFRMGDNRFRHAIDLDSDGVYLQRLNENAEVPEDEWATLVKYDCSLGIWDAEGKRLGDLHTEGDKVIAYLNPLRTRIECCSSKGVECFLDAEVVISKHLLNHNMIKEPA